MKIFGQSSPFDADVDKATSETNTNENWSLYLDVCDKVATNPQGAKDCLKAILKRMAHQDPHVVMQAITLLDACANNCGKPFHLEIASRDFENEYRRILKTAQPKISLKMRQVLKNWAENDFKNDPQLNLIPSFYRKLQEEGYDFLNLNDKPPKSAAKTAASADPNVVSSQQEEDDLAKAIELSLKEAQSSPKKQLQSSVSSGGAGAAAYPTLYPNFTGVGAGGTAAAGGSETSSASVPPEPRKVRALYDFEAAEENELTFFAGEIIHVTDDSDPNWWKGYNQRSDGLFPSNFVTADLSVDPERLDINKQLKSRKGDQFDDGRDAAAKELQEKTAAATASQPVEIDEAKIERLLHLLHEANPEDPSQDTEEMLRLEQEVMQMGPLIDAELERVDRKHAQLTQLSVDLVDAINLYHSLMRDDRAALLGSSVGPGPGLGGYAGGLSSGGILPGVGMSLGMNYHPAPHLLYGAAGYTGAVSNYAATTQFGGAGQIPSVSSAPSQQHGGAPQLPQATVASASGVSGAAGTIYASPPVQAQMIPMQYQNGVNTSSLAGAISQSIAPPMAPHLYAATGQQPPATTHYNQMLPPQQPLQTPHPFQQQQQGPNLTSNSNTMSVMDQQKQQQMQAPPPQQPQFIPSQQQTHAYMHSQQSQSQPQPQPQQQPLPQTPSFLPMPRGSTSSYMLPPPTLGSNNNDSSSSSNNNNPHQHPQHSSNDFTHLQQQMAAMSMAAHNATVGSAINQPVTPNFLGPNEAKTNIPIYQQQR